MEFNEEDLDKIGVAVEWYIRDGMASEKDYKYVLQKLKVRNIKSKKNNLNEQIKLIKKEINELENELGYI